MVASGAATGEGQRTNGRTEPMTDEMETTQASRGWPVVSTLLSGAVTWWLADVWDAQRLAHLAVWVVLGLVVLPVMFTCALAAVGSLLVAVLGVFSIPAWLTGRKVGLGGLARDLWRLAGSILPDYLRALRAVQKPWLWGIATGFVAGVAMRLAIVGLNPA